MSTPQPTERETAKVIIVQPGNGTRYKIVYGRDFVALPDFDVAATCTPFPAEYGYLKTKLNLRNDEDAKVIFEALRAEAEGALR
jgi:hypothetical protein